MKSWKKIAGVCGWLAIVSLGLWVMETPLHWGAMRGDYLTTSVFSKVPFFVNKKDLANKTPLYNAVYNDELMAARVLLDSGADPNISAGWDGRTPLQVAVANNNVTLARMLLKEGADPNATQPDSQEGAPAIYAAIEVENLKLVELLLDAGADTKLADNQHHKSALDAAKEKGNQKIVNLISANDQADAS